MILADVVKKLNLTVLAGEDALTREVTGGYTGDMISDVMANSSEGQIWITLQGHINMVAVGILRDLCGVILVNGRSPNNDALEKAEAEGLPILGTDRDAFQISGLLWALLKKR